MAKGILKTKSYTGYIESLFIYFEQLLLILGSFCQTIPLSKSTERCLSYPSLPSLSITMQLYLLITFSSTFLTPTPIFLYVLVLCWKYLILQYLISVVYILHASLHHTPDVISSFGPLFHCLQLKFPL